MPFTSMEYSSRASTPVEDSRSSTPGEYSSRSSTPEEDSSETPALPDALMRRYEEYVERQAQKCAPKSDRMKIGEILEDLEDDRDATYIIGLVQMYKGPNAKIKDDLYESKSLASAMFTLPLYFLFNLCNPYVDAFVWSYNN